MDPLNAARCPVHGAGAWGGAWGCAWGWGCVWGARAGAPSVKVKVYVQSLAVTGLAGWRWAVQLESAAASTWPQVTLEAVREDLWRGHMQRGDARAGISLSWIRCLT